MSVETAAATDVGRVRAGNEDFMAFSAQPEIETALLIVADGMGGAAAGEVASERAVEAFREHMGARRRQLAQAPEAEIEAALADGVAAANAEVWDLAQAHREWAGMGTTLVAACVLGDKAWVANVGDSRAYLIHDGKIRQLTVDHTVVGEAVRAGSLTAAQAASSPSRHILTRAVGTGAQVEADLFGPIALADGDALLLSSDGLHGVLSDPEIGAITSGCPPAEAPQRLIEAANARGGPDNITVVVARYTAKRRVAAA